MPTLYYPCEALINQGRFIGEDPIGHACTNKAEFQIGNVMLCKECVELVRLGKMDRISIPEHLVMISPEEKIAAWKRAVDKVRISEIGG